MTQASPEALLVALVLAPGTFSRNRHFHLFEQAALKRARRRARELRGIVRDLTEPWQPPSRRTSGGTPSGGTSPGGTSPGGASAGGGSGSAPPAGQLGVPVPDQIEGREVEGVIHLEYRVLALDFRRRAVLSRLEAAAVHYALAKSGRGVLSEDDRRQVEAALLELDPSRSTGPVYRGDE